MMELVGGALVGVAWQTKVECKKKGTRWSCSRGSPSGRDWVAEWLRPLQDTAEAKRDFLIGVPLSDMSESDSTIPCEYQYFVPITPKLVGKIGIPRGKLRGVHHSRRFVPTMAAIAGASEDAVMLQGNWATGRMPEGRVHGVREHDPDRGGEEAVGRAPEEVAARVRVPIAPAGGAAPDLRGRRGPRPEHAGREEEQRRGPSERHGQDPADRGPGRGGADQDHPPKRKRRRAERKLRRRTRDRASRSPSRTGGEGASILPLAFAAGRKKQASAPTQVYAEPGTPEADDVEMAGDEDMGMKPQCHHETTTDSAFDEDDGAFKIDHEEPPKPAAPATRPGAWDPGVDAIATSDVEDKRPTRCTGPRSTRDPRGPSSCPRSRPSRVTRWAEVPRASARPGPRHGSGLASQARTSG